MNFEEAELLLNKEELSRKLVALQKAEAHLDSMLSLYDSADGRPARKAELRHNIVATYGDLTWVERPHKSSILTSKAYRLANRNLQDACKNLISAYESVCRLRYDVETLCTRIRDAEVLNNIEEE